MFHGLSHSAEQKINVFYHYTKEDNQFNKCAKGIYKIQHPLIKKKKLLEH